MQQHLSIQQHARALGIACFVVLAALAPAYAQAQQPKHQDDCGEVERNYEMVKAQAVSIQTNIALFAAADRGCEALAKKLLDAGGSLLARDRRGAMPLAHAARGGNPRLVDYFLAQGAPIDARNLDGGTADTGTAGEDAPLVVASVVAVEDDVPRTASTTTTMSSSNCTGKPSPST